MSTLYTCILLFAFCLTYAWCEPAYAGGAPSAANHQNTLLSDVDADARGGAEGDASNYDKRVERYAFGLGRRAYTYTSGGNGVKRLPVYNFGLGKRARPYSFGLGKRADYDEDQYESDMERNGYNQPGLIDEKRNRLYSFGLGKRDADVMDDVDRRGYPNRYGFGLGRR